MSLIENIKFMIYFLMYMKHVASEDKLILKRQETFNISYYL